MQDDAGADGGMTRRQFMERGRDAAYGIGALGAFAGGGTAAVVGGESLIQAAISVSRPAYWTHEPFEGAYEPAIEYAAEHDAVTGRIAYLTYDTMDGYMPAPDNLDEDAYMAAVDTYLGQVGLDSDLVFETVDPAHAEFVPDRIADLHRFERGGYEKGLFALMDAVDDNMRQSESELIGVIGPFNQMLVGGQAPEDLDGVFQVDTEEGETDDTYGRVTAHEILHELGVGHTLFDGMSNVSLAQDLRDDRDQFFGEKSRNWWHDIADRYEDG